MKTHQPQIVIGVGGYASAPTLFMAQWYGISTLIQEQNSYAGLTNKWLARKATKICVAYNQMEKFFTPTKLVKTGNPIRSLIANATTTQKTALQFWQLEESKKTVVVIGGSLGARTINQAIDAGLSELLANDIQVIWQTGKGYFETAKAKVNQLDPYAKNIKVYEFIKEMDQAYAVADVVISRAGALSISELSVASKACILVPSPNVAEDHQTKNALALVDVQAAILVKDKDAANSLIQTTISLLNNHEQLQQLRNQIKTLAIADADQRILHEIEKIVASI
jgi:UDP-N-acetylglucosamine--N-acetylmuramyl-(pentapeptide) pyrophosphoryl-undecaprenol N-acetylglucosamine transferase